MTSLVPYAIPSDDTPAGLLATLTRARGLERFLKGRTDEVRARLEQQVRDLSAQTGAHFTLRTDDGQAYIGGGKPTVRIDDPEAFGPWAWRHPDAEVKALSTQVDRVTVEDHRKVAEWVSEWDPYSFSPAATVTMTGADLAAIIDSLAVACEWRVSENAADVLTSRPWTDHDGEFFWVDPETGETTAVPGVSVTYSREGLTVRPDSKVVARHVSELERLFAPALEEGAA